MHKHKKILKKLLQLEKTREYNIRNFIFSRKEKKLIMKTKKLLTWLAASTMLVGLASCAQEPAPEPEPEPEPVTLSSIELNTDEAKLAYFVGDDFETSGVKVTAIYSDDSKTTLASGYTFSVEEGYTFTEDDIGYESVTVTYQQKTADYTVRVNKVRLTGITLNTSRVKALYRIGEEFDPTGLVVTGHYSNGNTAPVLGYTVSTPDMSTSGEKTVYVTYENYRAEFTIEVREDYWYEVLEELFVASGIDMDLPTDILVDSGLEEAELYLNEDLNGELYVGLQFADLNPEYYSYLTYYLLVYYGIEIENHAFVGYDIDYYSYGYASFEVMSEINEEGIYADITFVGCDEGSIYAYYFDEEERFEMSIYFRQAYTAEELEEALTATIYGEDSIVKLDAELEEPVVSGLDEVAPYFAVNAEMTLNAEALAISEAFGEAFEPFAESAASFSDEYYYIGDDWLCFDYSPEQYSLKAMMEIVVTTLQYDFGFGTYLAPTLIDEEDELWYAVVILEEYDFAIELFTLDYYNDGTYYFEMDYAYLEGAFTAYADIDVTLPLAGDAEVEALIDKFSDEFTVYDYSAAYGYFAVSEELNEEYNAAWIQFYASEFSNALNISVFANSPLYETNEMEEFVNYFLNDYFGFTVKLPDFSEPIPYTLFGMASDYSLFQFQIFDNADPSDTEYYEGGALEEDVLAIFEAASDDWEIDDSQYETVGYVATSKEKLLLLPDDPAESEIKVTFYSYNYFFVMQIEIQYVRTAMDPAEVIASIDNYYGEGTAAKLDAFDLTSFADELAGEKFITLHGVEDGVEYWEFYSDNLTDDAYDLFYALATALYNSEDWQNLQTAAPGYSGEFGFRHIETGMLVVVYYGYDIDWETFSFINYGDLYIEMAPEAPAFSELLTKYLEEGGATSFESDLYAQLDNVEGSIVQSGFSDDRESVTIQTALDPKTASIESLTVYYNTLSALLAEIQADQEENPDAWFAYYDDYDTDEPIDGFEHTYYYVYYHFDEDGDYDSIIQIVFSADYGVRLRILLAGDFEDEEEQGYSLADVFYNFEYYAYSNAQHADFDMSSEDVECSWRFEFDDMNSGIGYCLLQAHATVTTLYQVDTLLGQIEVGLETYGLEYKGTTEDGKFVFTMDLPVWKRGRYYYSGTVYAYISYEVAEGGGYNITILLAVTYATVS